jgi:hypothetical protein
MTLVAERGGQVGSATVGPIDGGGRVKVRIRVQSFWGAR